MKQYLFIVTVWSCLGVSFVAFAQSDGISDEEQRLIDASLDADQAVEKTTVPVPGQDSAPGQSSSSNPNITLILNVAPAWFSTDEPQQLGAHDPVRTGFNFQQLELHMDSNVDPYTRLDADLVFLEEGVELESAHMTTLALPANLQFRAGLFPTRFGRLNPVHPHAWRFADQPLVNGKFLGGEGSRGVGVELNWLAPLPWFVEVVASAHNASGCCGRSYFDEEELVVDGAEDLLYTSRLQQFFPLDDDWSLLFGNSGQFGPNPARPGARTTLLGADLYLRWRPVKSASRSVSLQLEGTMRERDVPLRKLRDYGAYGTLMWGINPQWETAVRHEFVTGLDDDPLDPDWTQNRQRSTLQVTWRPSHFSRFRLQGSYANPSRDVAVMLAIEVLIGAHGAHTF